MNVCRDGELSAKGPSVVAIGVFDGLHRGHQAVLAQLIDLAQRYDATPTVVTFDPSPASVLAPSHAPRQIATVAQRLEDLAALGVGQVRILTFSPALARESAREFIERVLVSELHATCVLVGEGFHFGHNREGTPDLLREVGGEFGFDVVVAPTHGEGTRFSSSAVRAALAAGDLDEVERVLGRPFRLRGVVEHGDNRGEELGFPTANLAVAPDQALPAQGVYAGATTIDEIWWPAAISVGTRPQFYDDGRLLVEVHVVGYSGVLYGRELDVVFLALLRAQASFANVEELVAQIGRDVEQTRQLFAATATDELKLLG
ncbi:MAG TPA: bifunctional riboflavin kinase/FAD synthetase [Acidimicrobiales bacterium]|nr:bifunctional riboflavin kinase/FAD synthetase [Acidimicrobiales bacterium]